MDLINQIYARLPAELTQLFEDAGLSPEVVIALIAALFLLLVLLLILALVKREPEVSRLPVSKQSKQNIKILRKAEKLEKKGLFVEAAELYSQLEMFSYAQKMLSEHSLFHELGVLSLAKQMPEEAGKWFVKAGKLLEAADAYQQSGSFHAAGECYRQAGEWQHAAYSFSSGGNWLEAAAMFDRTGDFENAIKCWEKTGDTSVYALNVHALINRVLRSEKGIIPAELTQSVNWGLALRGAELGEHWAELKNLGSFQLRWAKVALATEKMGDLQAAVELYQRAGEYEHAARVMIELGRPAEAELQLAKHYENSSEWELAAHHYIQGGASDKAVDLYLKAGLKGEAAEILLNQGEYRRSADLFADEEDWKQAGYAYQQANDIEKAAECLAKTDEGVRAASLFLQVQQYDKAGELYDQLGMTDEAVQSFQKHVRSNPEDKQSAEKIANLLEQKELFSSAAETYNTLISGRPVSEENIAYYYRLARLQERMKKLQQARLIYEKILAYDLAYEDASARIEALQRKEMLNEIGAGVTSSAGSNSGAKRYEIDRELGSGGMGKVYLANDTILNRKIALKVLTTGELGKDAVDRLIEEARISAGLNHSNIVTVFDVSLIDGSLYLSMEYVEGQTLREIIRTQGPLPITPLLLLFGQACQGLAYAHERGVVHRDIKPGNLMWTGGKSLKIMDFGLAVAIQEMSNTQTLVVGTPHYMAPEQVMGDVVDGRADLYSLGVTMYEAATGKRPFAGGDVGYHHVHTRPDSTKSKRAAIPDELDQIIMRCLGKKAADRYDSANDVLADIKQVIQRVARGS